MAQRKVTIIGAGSVGSSTAFALTQRGLANEILLVDINRDRAFGEALDIFQGTPVLSMPVQVYSGDYEDAKDSSVVVITSGLARKPGQTRLDLTKTNVEIIKDIAPKITAVCPDATYVFVSNPVDILTYVFQKITGLPEDRVFGSGTLLDTARLRARIASDLHVSQSNVHAYVFGEHGESSFVPWSLSKISAVDLSEYIGQIRLSTAKMNSLDYNAIEEYIRSSGSRIIQSKGCTNYAIASSVCSIIERLFGYAKASAVLSAMMHGEYGIEDVCLSLPMLIGDGKIAGRLLPHMTQEEIEKLHHSADVLKGVIAQLDI